ncbi:MAG TPA: GWxTD domain-containing protein, partial [Candidatus Kapabacteria bacterium]|nr:GWxTD domain-containing protein [Candidatus Kapabacteria bacterium]
MKKSLYILTIFLLCISSTFAIQNKLSIDISSAQFYLGSDFYEWNLYYSFDERDLKFIFENDLFTSKIQFNIKFYSSLGLEFEDKWITTYNVTEINPDSDIKLFGLRSFRLKEGQYKVEFSVTDLNQKENTKAANFDLLIRKMRNDRLELSDIVLCNLILNQKNAGEFANEQFLRNSLYVYPNPSAEIYGASPSLKTYFEIHNANKVSPDGILLHYYIFDGANREVFYFPKQLKSLYDGMVETIEIPLDAIPTGVYNLVVAAKSLNSFDSVTITKKFYLINPDLPPVLELSRGVDYTFELSEFATMSEEQLDQEFQQVRFIATKEEIAQFRLLTDPVAKARFLFAFWQRRNSDTTSSINVARFNYKKRIEQANKFFSWGGKQNGWETDRGRTFLKY